MGRRTINQQAILAGEYNIAIKYNEKLKKKASKTKLSMRGLQ